jgi:hypothetical protein
LKGLFTRRKKHDIELDEWGETPNQEPYHSPEASPHPLPMIDSVFNRIWPESDSIDISLETSHFLI